MLTAGVRTLDISPWKGLELAGYPHYPRRNTGVHDPLYASCLYLENDGVEIAYVTLDILFFSQKYIEQVREKVERRCGIPRENVVICCAHTHSGPWASGRLDMEALLTGKDEPDAEYTGFLVEGIARIIELAKRDAFEASLGVYSVRCGTEKGVGGNRRVRNGVCDPSVNVIAVKDARQHVRGIFMNYTLHPTFIHEDSSVVTADYPGCIRQYFAQSHPDAVFGFSQGASGDQSSRYFREGQSYDEAARVAGALYEAAVGPLKEARFDDNPKLAVVSARIPLELREYEAVERLQARADAAIAEYERLKAEGADYLTVQNANLRMLGAEDILGYATLLNRGVRIGLLHDENPAEVTAIRLGDACIGCFPGEVFVEYGLRVKAESPFRLTIVSELAGCLPGYCYTPEALREGGYEVDTSMLSEDFGGKLTRLLIRQIERLWRE